MKAQFKAFGAKSKFSFSKIFSKKTLLLTHSGTDVDALASAAAIYFSLEKKFDLAIGCIDHVNLSAKALAKNKKIPHRINPDLKQFDSIVAVDFSSKEMLGTQKHAVENFHGKITAIDHHCIEKNSLANSKNILSDENAAAVTEIAYFLLKNNGIKIPKNAMECIAAGIIADTNNFTIASKNSFRIMAEVIEKTGKSFSQLSELFQVKKDLSEKIAALKSAKRCRIYKTGEYIAVTSMVDSFEASAAESLVRIGADVSFVASFDAKTDSISISARASSEFLKNSKINLAKHVFFELESKIDGKGGGHAGAAGFNCNGIPEIALEECIKILHSKILAKNLKAQFKEFT